MIRAELRSDGHRCYDCGAPLAGARVLSRSWRKIRSGEWIGSRGEFVTLACACRSRVRMLWGVSMEPRQRPAA